MKIVVMIPARGGSKRIPNKNIKLMNGKPLIVWSIEHAKKTTADEVWVSTEDKEIAKIAEEAGARIHWRPKELAMDKSMPEETLIHFSKTNDFDVILLLQCTVPLANEKDLQGLIDTYNKGGFDSVTLLDKDRLFINKLYGKYCFPINYNPFKIKISQDYKGDDWTYYESGIYLVSREWLLKSGRRMGGRNGYFIKHDFNIDIDNIEDFIAAERVMKWTKNGQ